MSGGIEFASESLEHFRANGLEELLEQHGHEIPHFGDVAIDPNWHAFESLERVGALRIFTARLDERLVGYVVYTVTAAAHARTFVEATQNLIFVAPEHRRSGIGAELIRSSESALEVEGVDAVYQISKIKPSLDFGALLAQLGYEPVETIWAKRLYRRLDG